MLVAMTFFWLLTLLLNKFKADDSECSLFMFGPRNVLFASVFHHKRPCH
jgi:hypothetical protein